MGRFVVLRHEMPAGSARPSHWDFMLECQGALRTWALATEPDSAVEIEAQQLADHRLAYLDYQGPVSGGRGTVTRWDAGQFAWECEDGTRGDDARLQVRLSGARLRGSFQLLKQADSSWRFSTC